MIGSYVMTALLFHDQITSSTRGGKDVHPEIAKNIQNEPRPQ
jgi:hypothetical protein